jgi:hypothetical protein
MPGHRTALIWTLRGLGVVALVLSVPQLITLGMIAAGGPPRGAPETMPMALDAALSFAAPLLVLFAAETLVILNKQNTPGNAR